MSPKTATLLIYLCLAGMMFVLLGWNAWFIAHDFGQWPPAYAVMLGIITPLAFSGGIGYLSTLAER